MKIIYIKINCKKLLYLRRNYVLTKLRETAESSVTQEEGEFLSIPTTHHASKILNQFSN